MASVLPKYVFYVQNLIQTNVFLFHIYIHSVYFDYCYLFELQRVYFEKVGHQHNKSNKLSIAMRKLQMC